MGAGFGIITWILSSINPTSVSGIMAKQGGKFYLTFLSIPFLIVLIQVYLQKDLATVGVYPPSIAYLNPIISVTVSIFIAIIVGCSLYYNELYLSILIYKKIKNAHPIANKISEGGSSSLIRQKNSFWGYMILSLLVCIAEEFIWRGFLLSFLINHFNIHIGWALLISSFLFGLNHLFFGLRNIFLKFIDGIVWGLLFLITSSLLIPILSHLTFQYFVWRRLQRQFVIKERVSV